VVGGAMRTARRRASRIDQEPDRRRAISLALGLAESGDVVVIAGKGHESTLTIGDTVSTFDDRVVVREVWQEMGGNT